MKIAVIGFGSLINDHRDLKVEKSEHPIEIPQNVSINENSPFLPAVGLTLPIRLARFSGQGTDNRRITMTLYPGASLEPAYFSKHLSGNLNVAIKNLREREGIPDTIEGVKKIAFVNLKNGTSRSSGQDITDRIGEWAKNNGFDAAIWTDLSPNISFAADSTGREIISLLNKDNILLKNTQKYIKLLPNPRNPMQNDIMAMSKK
ncbi:MAG: hypothetical protein ACHQUC_10985 [Chlamydiales bacterium]